jgi:hypothetical protein
MDRSLTLVLSCALLCATAGSARAQVVQNAAAWTTELDQSGAGFGSEVASAGDVNGDGFDDVLVAAYHFTGDFDQEGRAALYLGSPEGPSKLPDWSVLGGQMSANLGAVAGAGDVNGDGFDDVIVGTNGYDNHVGRAQLFLGGHAGLAEKPSWTAQPGDREFGLSVASAGDVDGDGFDDVIVGALGFSGDLPYEGRAHVYLGSATGLGTSAAWIVEGDQGHSAFGAAVASAGDVNGDGYDDVIVGAPRWNAGQLDEGRAFVYLGSPAGLATTPTWSDESDQSEALFGQWVSSAGDVNGDGFDDVLVSCHACSGGQSAEGAAILYLGGPGGPATEPSWRAESDQFTALAGAVSAGDIDGDGFSDVLAGFVAYDRPQRDEGVVFAYLGSASGPATRPSRVWEGNQRESMFGFAASTAGDVNGDGYDDVLVGAYRFDNGQQNEGRAFVYPGTRLRRF